MRILVADPRKNDHAAAPVQNTGPFLSLVLNISVMNNTLIPAQVVSKHEAKYENINHEDPTPGSNPTVRHGPAHRVQGQWQK